MDKPSIRRATSVDKADVQRLNKALYEYENTHAFYEDSYDLEWTYSEAGNKYFDERLSGSENSAVFVAELDGKIVGYLAAGCHVYTYRTKDPVAEIENMFVDENYRRHGIGMKLFDTFKKWAKGQGAGRLKVGSFSKNHPALAFYRKCGFHDFEVTLEQ